MRSALLSTLVFFLFPALVYAQSNSLGVDTTAYSGQESVAAKFPGGSQAWQKYLQKHTRSWAADHIKLAKNQHDSSEVVRVSFIIEKTGDVTEVFVADSAKFTPEVVQEAVRVIKKSPKWEPAINYGRLVRYRWKQVLTFNHSQHR